MTFPAAIQSVDPAEAERRLREGDPDGRVPLLVDVRNMDEFIEARVAGARFIPLPEFGERFEELPRDRPLLLFCRSGSRSAAATAHLLRQGWTDVANVDGGIMAWSRAGLPVVSGPLEPGEGS
ncbi:MAG: rhodanese-like domain-containing protein [Candidatus Limnocylindrales bacterium]|jgi:rhodanese-related sulfurtransferase